MRELLTLAAQIGDWKAARKIMPWAIDDPKKKQAEQASPDEIASAEAELEQDFVFN